MRVKGDQAPGRPSWRPGLVKLHSSLLGTAEPHCSPAAAHRPGDSGQPVQKKRDSTLSDTNLLINCTVDGLGLHLDLLARWMLSLWCGLAISALHKPISRQHVLLSAATIARLMADLVILVNASCFIQYTNYCKLHNKQLPRNELTDCESVWNRPSPLRPSHSCTTT